MGLDDFQGFGDDLANELDKLDQYDEVDRPFVKRFVRKLDGRVKDSTMSIYLNNLRNTAGRLDQPLVTLSEIAFEEHVYNLRHSDEYGRGDEPGFSDGTVRNIEFAVRKFLTTVGDDADADLEWAEDYQLTSPPDATVDPDDMLTGEDINALTDGANNMRDVALIEFLADTGARLSLVGTLRVGDVELEGDRATYTPNPNASGLKGAPIKEYPIIDSAAVLRSYLRNTHPRPRNDDVAFFHKLAGHGNDAFTGDGSLSSTGIRSQLRKAAEAAGVEKPVNPHNFRHSAVSRMIREGYSRSEVEHRVAWTVDTDMWPTYEHISADEHNDAIFEQAGVVDGDDADTLDRERRPCGNCGQPVAPHHHHCPTCGWEASKQARDRKQAAISSLGKSMAELDDMSRREFYATLLEHVQADPSDLQVHDSPSSSSSDSSRS